MSLKGFHIVFITLSTLCLAGFAVWALMSDVDLLIRLSGGLSAVLGVALAFYGAWFYRHKLRDSKF